MSCWSPRILNHHSSRISLALLASFTFFVKVGGGIESSPDGHVWSGNLRQLDSSRETLVTHRVIILEPNLELNGLEDVPLLLICGVVQ